MKKLVQLVLATGLLTTACAASAQDLTDAQARAAIAPWYNLFNQPVQGDMRTLQEQVLTADYESCWGYLPGECWGRDASINVVGGFTLKAGQTFYEGPTAVHVVGRNASNTDPARFVVVLLKAKGAPILKPVNE